MREPDPPKHAAFTGDGPVCSALFRHPSERDRIHSSASTLSIDRACQC